jgi:hypothetical protein
MQRRRFELIERRVLAGGDLALASLAEEIPNRFVATVVTIADQGMNGRVGDLEVFAVAVWTGVTLGVDGLLAATGAFALGVGDNCCGASRYLTAFAADGAVIRGARAQGTWRVALGRWRGGAPPWEVAQLEEQGQEKQGQSQGEPGFKMKSEHSNLTTDERK